MARPPRELLELVGRYDAPVQLLALAVRRLVLEEVAPRHEYVFAMRSKLVMLYGSTERIIADSICAINLFREHVNLGFHYGAELKNAGDMLRGTGKSWRHIKLEGLTGLERPEVRASLREAREHAGLPRPARRSATDLVTHVKPGPRKKLSTTLPRLY